MGFKDYIFIRRVGYHLEYKFSKFRPDLVKMVSSKALSTTLLIPLSSNVPANIHHLPLRPNPPMLNLYHSMYDTRSNFNRNIARQVRRT